MGKLTDSLRGATDQLKSLQEGIDAMEAVGQDLADNAFAIADAALRTGYAYGKAEAAHAQGTAGFLVPISSENSVQSSARPMDTASDVASSELVVLEADQRQEGDRWTQTSLKQRFGKCDVAYQHLRDVYGVRLKKRSWQAVVDGFNRLLRERQSSTTSGVELSEPAIAAELDCGGDRLTQLERTVAAQQQRILILEQQVRQLMHQFTDCSNQEHD